MSKFFTSLSGSFICLFFLTNFSFAQNIKDDPNLDQVPLDLIQQYIPQNEPKAIITVDGYDNFFMGTDFAEPHTAMNPNNNLQVFTAWNTNSARWTNNGGIDWLNSTPNFGQSMRGDPVIAYDSLGNLYYENMYGATSILGCYVLKSTNNGANWGTPVLAIAGVDKNWIAADQTSGPFANYVYTTMTKSGGGNFARSTNFGQSFVNTYSFTTQTLPGMMVAVGANVSDTSDVPGGSVYVVTNSGSSYASVYTIYRSTDGGLTFTQRSSNQFSNYVGDYVNSRNSVQNMRTRPYPFIAADNSYGPFRGRLYLVYSSNTPVGAGNKSDVFSRYSTDQGATWSAPVIINDDANSNLNQQWHSSIWCDKETGKLYAHWMDTRDIPTSDSAYIYASFSSDGGVTWVPNQRISNRKMKINCTTCGGGGTPRYQGDYNAITSSDVSFHVWTDFRNNTFGSYSAYFPDFAMTVSASKDSVANSTDESFYTVKVPSVKSYSDTSIFSVTVSPSPTSGTITISTVNDRLTTYPDSVVFKVTTNNVSPGIYNLTFKGEGPKGIPVHTRTAPLRVYLQIPVELISFTASNIDNKVNLAWSTATETNNRGFQVERAFNNNEFHIIGFINGKGTTSEKSNYSLVDDEVKKTGKYSYRLKQIDFDGQFAYSNNVEVNLEKPLVFDLLQNYPNPFNPSTSISYTLPEKSIVKIKIFDMLGNEVVDLVNEEKEAGEYRVDFNASNLSSGVYFYRLETGSFVNTKRMMLIK